MENTAGPATPLAFVTSRKSGVTQTSGAVAGVDEIVVFQTNDFLFLNGIIDRPTTSQFRALIAGFYRVAYNIHIEPNTNDRGCAVNIILNGLSDILSLRSKGIAGKINADRGNDYINSKIIQLAANDIITCGVDPIEGVSMDILTDSALCFELVRPI